MVDEVVPKEQMEVFDRPREMAAPAPEEMMVDEPQAAMSDTGLRRDDPRLAFAALATFLVDLEPDKINQMKSFTMGYPRVTEAVSETLQMAPEELNDLFDASLGDPNANQRMLQKFASEEDMAMVEQMQDQPQMPMQAEQPRFEKGGLGVETKKNQPDPLFDPATTEFLSLGIFDLNKEQKVIAKNLIDATKNATQAIFADSTNVDELLATLKIEQDNAENFGLSEAAIDRAYNIGSIKAEESFLKQGGSKLSVMEKQLPFGKLFKSTPKIQRTGEGLGILGDRIAKALSTGEKSGLFGTGEKPRGSITPERAAFRDTRGLVSPQ